MTTTGEGAAARATDSADFASPAGALPPASEARRALLRTAGVVALAVALCVLASGALVWAFYFNHLGYEFFDVSDILVYSAYAGAIARGLRPYVDFAVEYPPLAIPLFTLPGIEAHLTYGFRFAALMFGFAAAGAALTGATAARLWPTGRRAYVSAATYAVAVLATGAILANRFDVAFSFVIAACLFFLSRRWFWPAGLVLGLGFALKFVPAILLPLALVAAARRRSVAWTAAAFTVGAVAPFLPYLPEGATGLFQSFAFHSQRPLQFESVFTTPLYLAHLLGGPPIQLGYGFGAYFIQGSAAKVLAQASGVVGLALLAWTYLLAWRRRAILRSDPGHLALLATTLVLAFLASGKVLSPQFMMWLLPCVALVLPQRPLLGGTILLAEVLTHIEFPGSYESILALYDPALALLVTRNVVLVAAFVLALVELRRLPEGPVTAEAAPPVPA